MRMTLSTNGVLAIHQHDRAIIIDRVTPAKRVSDLIATGRAPIAAELITAGAPPMLASAVSLFGWHDAYEVLSRTELDQAALWKMRSLR